MKIHIGKFPKNAGNRRVDVQIDNYDTWGLDHNLALIIYPALMQLKATKHGVPNEFGEVGGENYGHQLSFDFYMDSHNEAFDESCKKWDEVLDKMIWSFYQIAYTNYDAQYHHGNAKYDFVKSNIQYPNPLNGQMEDAFEMVDLNPDEHWFDSVGLQEHEKRIQEGLDLFGKYFRALWD